MANVYCFQPCSFVRVNAKNPISEFFQRTHDRVEPGAAIGVEHPSEVKTKRFGDEHERAEVKHKFQPLMGVHSRVLKFFRPHHGEN